MGEFDDLIPDSGGGVAVADDPFSDLIPEAEPVAPTFESPATITEAGPLWEPSAPRPTDFKTMLATPSPSLIAPPEEWAQQQADKAYFGRMAPGTPWSEVQARVEEETKAPQLKIGPDLASVSEMPVSPGERITQQLAMPEIANTLGPDITAQITREAWNLTKALPEFFGSIEGLEAVAVGTVAPAAVGAYFTYSMLKSVADQASAAGKDWDQMSLTDKVKSVVDIVGTGIMAGTLTGHLGKTVKAKVQDQLAKTAPALEAPAVTGAALTAPKGAVPSERAQALAAVREQAPEVEIEPSTGTLSTPAERAIQEFEKGQEPPSATGAAVKPTPPTKPTVPAGAAAKPEAAAPTVQPTEPTASPHDFEPALLVDGKPVTGGENHDAIKVKALAEAKTQEERNAINEAFLDDSQHVFVDKQGNILSRDEAGTKLGEKGPLQSSRLAELKKATPKPTAPAPAAPIPKAVVRQRAPGDLPPEIEAVGTTPAKPAEEKSVQEGKDVTSEHFPIFDALGSEHRVSNYTKKSADAPLTKTEQEVLSKVDGLELGHISKALVYDRDLRALGVNGHKAVLSLLDRGVLRLIEVRDPDAKLGSKPIGSTGSRLFIRRAKPAEAAKVAEVIETKQPWEMTPEEFVKASGDGSTELGAQSKQFWDRVQGETIESRKKNPSLDYEKTRQAIALRMAAESIELRKRQNQPAPATESGMGPGKAEVAKLDKAADDARDLRNAQVQGSSAWKKADAIYRTAYQKWLDAAHAATGEGMGPGTPSAAQPSDVLGTQLAQLTGIIRQQSVSPREPFGTRLRAALSIADRWSRGKDAVIQGMARAKAASSALWDAYLNLPPWRDFQTAVGRWTGADQQTSLEVRQFNKVINRAIPNKLRQEAITNWIQADGDEALLRQRADASRGSVKKGYELALTLNDAEKTIARNIGSYLDARLQEGLNQGILKQGVDNYVTQIWKRPTVATNRMWADLFGAGRLNPNFRFARKRIFDSYFEGEQAGFTPRSKAISHLISTYDLAFNRSLSARALIRELHEGTAADGNPIVMISGSSSAVPKGEPVPEAYLIKPKTRPKGAVAEDGRPYRPVDHWALRDWKWVDKTPDGQNIILQGDMLVHPDYATFLSRVLHQSVLRQIPAIAFLLRAGAFAKQTKLSLSPFHTVQEGYHATAHRVDPTGIAKRLVDIDLSHPQQKSLVDHGLMVSDYRGSQEFAEGLSGGGLVGKIPGLGRLQQWYTDMTFQDYIPKLKMTMALDALKRNRAAYAKQIERGKVTDDQIVAMTARQSNAAFGEQNYRMMGRSSTLQDFLRLTLLAPDFLEARFRFVGQALKPYGREQRIALGIMGASLYTTGRILNRALDDDYHWDKPFSIFHQGREYHLRTILGDVQHLMTDPRGFWYNRLAPITRTISEYVTGRDERGIKRSSVEQFTDFLSWFKPIPLQTRPGTTVPQAILAASGIPSRQATERQQLYTILDDWRSKQSDPKVREAYDRQRQETHAPSPYTPLRMALQAGDLKTARTEYDKLLTGRTPRQIAAVFKPYTGGTVDSRTGMLTPTKPKPFTGSSATEGKFIASLTPEQRKIYKRAQDERKMVYQNYRNMLQSK